MMILTAESPRQPAPVRKACALTAHVSSAACGVFRSLADSTFRRSLREYRRVKPSVLLVECPDRPGLVHAITGVLFRRGMNVVGNQEFVDRSTGRFFMRTEFDG